jgi:hypothetical protein
MKAWGAVAAAALILVVLPPGAVAKSGFFVQGPQRWSEFSLPAANGYRVTVSATQATRKSVANVYVRASKGRQRTVEYSIRGVSRQDGLIDAKLPGVGRIAVRFNPKKVTRQTVADNCKGRATVVRHGIFRGTIEINGEQGYTSVHRRSSRGTITQSFRQVCGQREPGGERGPGPSFHQKILIAGSRKGPSLVSFTALEADFGPKFGGPVVLFLASSEQQHDGLHVSNRVLVEGKASGFSISDPPSSLEAATIEPPPPFQGSATFHLDSPRSSSWTGTLSVELPGVGQVALAGDGFWSALCVDGTCTKTLPFGVGAFSVSFN